MRGLIAGITAGVLLVSCDTRGRFEGVAVDPPRAMAPVAFTLPDSTAYTLGGTPDGATVVFFGYTHCPDVCPTTLADWKRVKAQLGRTAERVRFVFVTVDPERDTPAVALRYARQFDSTFVGLSGDAPTTARTLELFGVAAAREAGTPASGYLVSHSSQQFLLDERGALVALYPFGTRWEALAADLERLL
ncbi:MAG: SCO family protein [Gemmatimonas sp.]|uniref:SCO family protein n=1 Tax=Gemmatimonas sp. TaxID=1962908 RepID=UPI0025C707C0|nr:SCO family protein [Gemmatimonas sp.]MCE2953811.1 SCO family protein [Gemmatimonas sp.]